MPHAHLLLRFQFNFLFYYAFWGDILIEKFPIFLFLNNKSLEIVWQLAQVFLNKIYLTQKIFLDF